MMSRQEVIDAACWAVGFAKQHLDYIEFSAEDASRSDPDYLVQVFAEVIRCGAVTLNVPDTTGYAVPDEFGALFQYLIAHTPGGDGVRWSAHCHNDLGMAVANSLAAVRNGARQIECTINGIGERAGNTSMEEVVMALKTRSDVFRSAHQRGHRADLPGQPPARAGHRPPVPANKPIVGDNAFAHEAGIHQDGVLKDKLTYEIMRPESVGISSNKLVLGKHSGRHAFAERLKQLGVDLYEVDMNQRLRALQSPRRQEEERLRRRPARHRHRGGRARARPLRAAGAAASRRRATSAPHARVRLRVDGQEREDEADRRRHGRRLLQGHLQDHRPDTQARSLRGQGDHRRYRRAGEVSCLVQDDGITASGQGAHTDIIQASALAFINALNKLEYRRAHYRRDAVDVGP